MRNRSETKKYYENLQKEARKSPLIVGLLKQRIKKYQQDVLSSSRNLTDENIKLIKKINAQIEELENILRIFDME